MCISKNYSRNILKEGNIATISLGSRDLATLADFL
jgi:hypothetical protein